MSEPQRVLFIAYLFPPQGGGGVQRTVKFLKYLPDFGWRGIVLAGPEPSHAVDRSLGDDVPAGTYISRVQGISLPARLPWRVKHAITQWVLTVDAEIGWLPFAVRRGLAMVRQHQPKALYSTSAPYTDHLVALRLKKATGLPWVADFRDPWLENFSATFVTPLHQHICMRLEATIVRHTDRVLVVSEPMRQQFVRRYPQLPASHFVTIPNGYDRTDYVGVTPTTLDTDRFTLVYTGSLYGVQSAHSILHAVQKLLETGLIPRQRFRLLFVGATGKETETLVTKLGLGDVVVLCGYLPHAQMIGYQLSADVLLFIIGRGPNVDAVLTGKIFEYLATGKPILALTPPGAAADLLTEAGVGRIVAPEDIDAIMDALLDMFTQWHSGNLVAIADPGVVARFDRRCLTKILTDIFNQITQ